MPLEATLRLSPGLVRHDGNAQLFRSVEMSILSTLAGSPLHLHAEGLRGTGKTTILRAARQALPRVRRIKSCLFNCDPERPHCPQHGPGGEWEAEWIPMPFLEISHSAKVGTVVGSVDLGRLTEATRPQAALLPGSLPQAHRGIIFVDEINRLADTAPELADVLLDVMGTKPGRIQIEETGLPRVELPLSVSVWAASNPDEDPGPLEDIRKQLSDRFDFVIGMSRPGRVEVVAEILACRGSGRREASLPVDESEIWHRVLARYGVVVFPLPLRRLVASLYVDFSLESLRSVEALQLGAHIHAVLEGRDEVALRDVLAVAPLALHHRADLATITEIMKHLEEWGNRPDREMPRRAADGDGGADGQVETPGEMAVAAPPATPARSWGGLLAKLKRSLDGPGAVSGGGGKVGGTAGWQGGDSGSAGMARRMVDRGSRSRDLTAPGALADPMQVTPFAPPALARPMVELPPDELVRLPEVQS
ncbi:MAG: magnesium chelatase [bacterium]|nr:magnesium chelatase [bacterium]